MPLSDHGLTARVEGNRKGDSRSLAGIHRAHVSLGLRRQASQPGVLTGAHSPARRDIRRYLIQAVSRRPTRTTSRGSRAA